MATASKPHKGDVGSEVELNAHCDISDATVLKIKYRTPTGTTGEWVGEARGTEKAYHTTVTDQLEDGAWSVQLYIETPDGKWHGDIGKFTVAGNIEIA